MANALPIKVFLVDDHSVFREGLSAQVNQQSDMVVVGDAKDAASCFAPILHTKPDVVLADVNMPGQSIFSVAVDITKQDPGIRFLFLSAFNQDVFIEQAIEARAWGFLTKSESFTTISRAIRDVKNGWVHYSRKVKERLVDTPQGPRLARQTAPRRFKMTVREIELLRYIASGMSVKEIAQTMCISCKTVDCHKTNLMSKLDLHNRVDLARFAFREGVAIP